MTWRCGVYLGVAALLGLGGCSSKTDSGTTQQQMPTAVAPTFSPAPGNFTAAQSVTLADSTPGASIYYTTNGTAPTSSSIPFSESSPIAVSSTTTIEAIAVAVGYSNSTVATGTYTINLPAAATPTFSPAPGNYLSAQTVMLADATSGASIYYTTDGATPTASSTLYSAASPISVSSTTTVEAIAVAPGYAASAVASGAYTFPSSGSVVSVVQSTNDQSQLLAAQPSLSFTSSSADAGTNTIVVDATQQYQSIEGFGAAFTDSAAYLLNEVAKKSQEMTAMSNLFTRAGTGIGLSFMRIPMGASDIARSVYSYDDQPAGDTDLTLSDFSIAHDQTDIIPIIQQAKTLNPQMKLLASPWSPPGWMKDPSSMNPVSMLGGTLLMTSTNETAFADYFVRYLQAYQAAGIPIDYLTIQNEPLNITNQYPSMGMSDNAQLSLLQGYVLPALSAADLSTKVMVYDHNWDTSSYPETVLNGLTPQQLTQVAGTAWHGYSGTPGVQQAMQNLYPSLGNWMTEHSGGTWISDQFVSDFLEITQVMRNSAKSYVKWSLALDQNLGPDLTQDASLGGCNTCTPIVTVNNGTGAVTYDIEYYTLGHYSKYVLPGAVRIYSSNTPTVATVAFQNPDGSIALIAYNNSTASQSVQVQWGATQSFSYTLPGTAAATFTWSGTQSGTPVVAATAQIQGASYSQQSGLETEDTGDATGEYDLGYLTSGSYISFQNVDFGTAGSIKTVNVRTASGGNGGTATFYLDSMTSTPIATVNLPVTGGWQTWQTVNAPVSTVSGVHNFYVVFSGGGTTDSISNVNWLQFE
ncbi:MAG TPA: chitobiase/beta-hexosaminidase C-terminal domain-containing protein [Acidobacteriaceae bacterium]|nr:chitobiase/beta-hexosaminidase C-terminal domain-containing protein [Acidobacteriaceae bacterium]